MAKAMADMIQGEVVDVPVGDLSPWEGNPRVGDVGALMNSLLTLGQFRPILVRPDNTILAGHHVVEAAKQLGWPTVRAVVVTVDDERAAKIVLADNRLADMGTYDLDLLVDSLTAMDDLMGTGYDEADLAALVGSLASETLPPEDMAPVVPGGHGDPQQAPEAVPPVPVDEVQDTSDEGEHQPGLGQGLGDGGHGQTAEEHDEDEQDDEDHANELTSFDVEEQVLRLDPEAMFRSQARWHIPEIRGDMVIEDLPELTTWASAKVTPPQPAEHYLYNYAVDTAVGLPWDRALVGFYCNDRYFEGWWDSPDYYVARLAKAQAIGAITPNFSVWEWPLAVSIFNVYRSRWLGRFFQEAGIRVIPDIMWAPGSDELMEATMAGLPEGLPWLSIQVQAVTGEGQTTDRLGQELVTILDELKPENILVYGGESAGEMVNKFQPQTETRMRWQPSRYLARHGVLYNRDPG